MPSHAVQSVGRYNCDDQFCCWLAPSRTFGGRAKTRYSSTSSCAGNRAAVRPPFVFAIFGTVSLSRV